MKAKTIKSVLKRKHQAWIESIQDEKVKELAKSGTIITGGAIASMLLREKVNDFDLYFRNRETALAVARYYLDQFKKNPPTKFKSDSSRTVKIYLADGYGQPVKDKPSSDDERAQQIKVYIKSAGIVGEDGSTGYAYFEMNPDPNSADAEDYLDESLNAAQESKKSEDEDKRPPYRPIFMTSNAITLSDDVQIVLRFYGEPDKIHENYDFVHCTNYWTSWDGNLVLRPEALESLLSKELRYVGSKYPLCSFIRTRKFIKREWTINAGQFLKMAMQLNDLNLDDVTVLEDQLTGVDAAYFMQVIAAIKERNDQVVDRNYLLELIDRIF